MKRVGYLYEKIFTYENLTLAIANACKNKKDRKVVKKILDNKDELIRFIQTNPDYVSNNIPTPRRDKSSGKIRNIVAPDIVYLVKQHAIIQIINPYLSKSFYFHSYGSVRGKGIHKASKQLRKKLKNGGKYAVTIDTKKYYDSIDLATLKGMLLRKFKDKKLLNLLFGILGNKEKGISIGNYSSQIFANIYFTPLDHYIVEKLKPHSYIRQMDDMQLLDNNKRKLKANMETIIDYIRNELKCDIHSEKLEIKNLTQSIVRSGITKNKFFVDFCGYKHYLGGKVEIRKRIFKRLRETIFKLSKYSYLKLARKFMSYWGYVIKTNNYKLLNKYMPLISMADIRACIRNGGKRLCNT